MCHGTPTMRFSLVALCFAGFSSAVAGNDIVEALVFSDERCTEALGRIEVVADGKCQCVDCGRWGPPSPSTATMTLTQTYDRNTSTVTRSMQQPTPTGTMTIHTPTVNETLLHTPTATIFESDVLIYPSSAIGAYSLLAFQSGLNCTACNLFPVSLAIANCNSADSTFTISLTDSYDCKTMSDAVVVPVNTTKCVSLGLGMYAMLAKSTCRKKSSSGMSTLEVVLTVVLIVGTILLGLVAGYAVWVWKNLKTLMQLRSDIQKGNKEDAALKDQYLKSKDNLAKQLTLSSKVADEIENITGSSVLTNGVIGAANSVAPPSLPLREEIDQLAAQMAQVEADIDLQKKITRDAMT
eukprot:TRINITY_DN15625_c0_g1_i2.p1 TRINITY_DN15625_c0_g1~~TRINITY_DN15625_c0_g1_i2.p1  ORF type:complete len:352 (+),score=57.98 TRINITY_DN15625_c0_g1_i2:34-1089(+)